MNRAEKTVCAVVVVGWMLASMASAADVFNMPPGLTSLEFVRVGNPGNEGELSGDPYLSTDRVCGAVDYTFKMGKYEVTVGQYTEFLNAVAKTDTYGLYYPLMDTTIGSYGYNIKQTGGSGNYTYTVGDGTPTDLANWANRPVNLIDWGRALRFCNWLSNGQPTGAQDLSTTEDGSYYLNGGNGELCHAARRRPLCDPDGR